MKKKVPIARINGINFNYVRRRAKGPPVVLIHGLATNLAFWYFRIVPLLAASFDLTLYDLRGHGRSSMPHSGYSTAELARDLDALLTFLGVEQSHVIGHSYGGAVALHYAVDHPRRVASLVLADARIRSLQPSQPSSAWPDETSLKRALAELDPSFHTNEQEMGYGLLKALAESRVQDSSGSARASTAFPVFAWSNRSQETARQYLRLLQNTTAHRDITDVAGLTPSRIGELQMPCLAIYGEYSNCLPSCRALQVCLPACETAIMPRVGHFHPAVHPANFAQLVNGFVARHAADRQNPTSAP